ncbi:MAG TPA: hypothetical protein VLM89_12285 [Phycisphaerae bacterium]|nr:hypothetical protein [Phycisphaerae bacterium]
MSWEQAGLVVGVLSPLVGAPLIVITLYLRAIREQQTASMAEITHRIQTIEVAIHDLLKSTADLDREYATKEEWVRESMVTRQRLEKLTEMTTRIQAELENGHCVAAEMGRMATAMTRIAEQMRDRPTKEVSATG